MMEEWTMYTSISEFIEDWNQEAAYIQMVLDILYKGIQEHLIN